MLKTQVQAFTDRLKDAIVEYTIDKNITDTDTINEYNSIAENFVLDLKKAIQNDVQESTLGFQSRDEAKKLRKKRENLEGIVFGADVNAITQIAISGKNHPDYYGIHLTDLEELTTNYLYNYPFLHNKYFDLLLLRVHLYYHAVTFGELNKENATSISNLAMYQYSKGGAIRITLFRWIKQIAYAFIFFGLPLAFTMNSYFENNYNFPTHVTLLSIYLIIFFPRYIIRTIEKNKDEYDQSIRWKAYSNLWIAICRKPYALKYMKKTIQNLMSSDKMIFETTTLHLLDKIIERNGDYLFEK